jgi:vancomycin resistance protein YoaR
MARSLSGGNLASMVARGFGSPLATLREFGIGHVLEAGGRSAQITGPQALERLRWLFFRWFLPTAMALLFLLAIGLVVFRLAYEDRLYPAIVVGDVAVGGLTPAEAQERITERATALENGTISFSFGGQTWTPTLSELGVTVLLDESIEEALWLGREGSSASRLAFMGEILNVDQIAPLQTQIDQGTLNTWFDSIDRDLGQLPVNAQIEIDGSSVSVSPGTDGMGVDREAATAHLVHALSTLQPQMVSLPTAVLHPDITAGDLVSVRAEVEQVLSEPVPVTFEDQQWTIEGPTLAPFLHAETVMGAGGPTARLHVDTRELARELRTRFSPLVNRKPTDALIGWNNGLVVVEPSTTGAVVRSNAFADAVEQSVLNGHSSVTIPVVTVAPEIDGGQLDAYGIDTLLGQGDSNFDGGNEGRDENIRVGTDFLNGTLVPPRGTFSFNEAIGEITYEKGYKDAIVATAEMVGPGVGGGVCQLSTTVFRAAIYAGMPIKEWYPHTNRLPNYERDGWGPGFDASILQVGPTMEDWADFKFENNTDNWLLVEATISYPHVYVNIYGSDDGRSVDTNAYTVGDNAFAFTRVIYDAQGTAIEERTFESPFE